MDDFVNGGTKTTEFEFNREAQQTPGVVERLLKLNREKGYTERVILGA
jgi:acetolactate synthase regulatory subunit